MPPRTSKPEGTAYSRRKEYLREQLRKRVPYTELDNFFSHLLKVGKETEMRMPNNLSDFSRRIRRFRQSNSEGVGLSSWSLDLVEAALVRWDNKPVKSPAENSAMHEETKITETLPPAGINFDPTDAVRRGFEMRTVPPEAPRVPADISFLMLAVPALEGMTENERKAALNYLGARYA